jgi:hypothetical protein
MQITPKTRSILLGAALLCAGAAIDRGLHFVNWHFIKLGLMGEQAQICPTENAAPPKAQLQPQQSVARASEAIASSEPTSVQTQMFRAPPAPIALPPLALSPMRTPDELGLVKPLAAKPQAANTPPKDKDKDEPAVNVDLSKGRKDSANNQQK